MVKTVIPEKVIITCDFCGDEITPQTHKKEAKLTLNRNALDYQGSPVADGSVSFDMCDKCEGNVATALNSMVDEAYGGEKA